MIYVYVLLYIVCAVLIGGINAKLYLKNYKGIETNMRMVKQIVWTISVVLAPLVVIDWIIAFYKKGLKK